MPDTNEIYQIGDLVITQQGVSVVAGMIRIHNICTEVITQPLGQLFSGLFFRYPLNQVRLARLETPPGGLLQ